MTASPQLKAAIRKELSGNTRHDLITRARRVLRNPPSKAELARAKLVMAIDEGKAWPLPKQEQSTPTRRAQSPKTI